MKQHSSPRFVPTLIAIAAALALPAGAASSLTGLFAFGDSLTDSGNLYTATAGAQPASPPYFSGRFSNGPTWVEVLASDHLGLPAISNSLAGGNNHAWGGSWTGGGGDVPTLVQQVGGFISGGGSFAPMISSQSGQEPMTSFSAHRTQPSRLPTSVPPST